MVRAPTRWTVDDYHQMTESGLLAGRQVELIDGQIFDIVPERPIHRVTYRRGARYLEQLLGKGFALGFLRQPNLRFYASL